MASGYSHLLFVDADLGWEPAAVGRLLMASEHHDVCCGVYPKKCDPLGFPVNLVNDDGGPVVHPESGYVKLHDACTGFMMIRRGVIEQMIAAYPDRKCSFREESGTPADEGQYEYDLFDFYIDRNCPRRMLLSEDFGFTRLYQAIGGEVWADPEIRLAHHGHKRYEGAIADILIPA